MSEQRGAALFQSRCAEIARDTSADNNRERKGERERENRVER